jgi:site-specific recombinase XerD
MSEWKKTKYPGVRFREHETRKHGIGKDRYFVIRFQRDGKRREEGIGWASEGWTAEKAANELAELKKAHTLGTGAPTRLSEKRELVKVQEERKQAEEERRGKEAVTFGQYFEQTYFPVSKTIKKPKTYRREKEHFDLWLKPVLAEMPFKEIFPLTIERVKKNLQDAGKATRTIQYVLATIRQVWNQARRDRLVMDDSPTKEVKLPTFDNRRIRFLNHAEADALLEQLQVRDLTTWRMALLSLHCGLRAGEVFSLVWGHVYQDRGLIMVDGKGEKSRAAYMTTEVKAMFDKMKRRGPSDWVFTDKNENPFKEIPTYFDTAVKTLNFNKGITDRRNRACFHTMRHTFASWQVQSGTDLYTVQKLLGHSTIAMTERYSHLSPGALQNAVKNFEKSLTERKQEPGKVIEMKKQAE